ncbi:hypothetical protein MKW92_026568, partial [Papaver armeniacum]
MVSRYGESYIALQPLYSILKLEIVFISHLLYQKSITKKFFATNLLQSLTTNEIERCCHEFCVSKFKINSSIFPQQMELEKHDLVVSGNVTKKKFSHCLDGRNGIEIVVVGDVVQPNQSSIEVGKDVFNFSSVVFPVRVSDEVFPGTAMSYFPEGIFKKLYKM